MHRAVPFGVVMKACYAGALLLLGLSCASPTRPVVGGVSVRAAPPVLVLTNESSTAVYYFVIERYSLIEWANPYVEPDRFERIAPGRPFRSRTPPSPPTGQIGRAHV